MHDSDFLAQHRQNFWKKLTNFCKTNTNQATYRREYIANMMYDNNIKSVLELGCSSGGNLLYILKKCKDINAVGIDICKESIEHGKLVEKNTADMRVGSLYDLKEFGDNSFDMVFTCTVLIHIPPEKIKDILNEMIRISRNFVMNIEDNQAVNKPHWYKGIVPKDGIPHRWETNYIEIYKQIGYDVNNQDIVSLMGRADGGANNILWLSKSGDNLTLRK